MLISWMLPWGIYSTQKVRAVVPAVCQEGNRWRCMSGQCRTTLRRGNVTPAVAGVVVGVYSPTGGPRRVPGGAWRTGRGSHPSETG